MVFPKKSTLQNYFWKIVSTMWKNMFYSVYLRKNKQTKQNKIKLKNKT